MLDEAASQQPRLNIGEWLAVVTVVGFLCSVMVISSLTDRSPELPIFLTQTNAGPATYRVYVEGAVKSAGWLRVPPGTQLCDLYRWADLQIGADEAMLAKKRPIRDGEIVSISPRSSL
jgi:hypothetical protein